jgi:segregation and condensation protein B
VTRKKRSSPPAHMAPDTIGPPPPESAETDAEARPEGSERSESPAEPTHGTARPEGSEPSESPAGPTHGTERSESPAGPTHETGPTDGTDDAEATMDSSVDEATETVPWDDQPTVNLTGDILPLPAPSAPVLEDAHVLEPTDLADAVTDETEEAPEGPSEPGSQPVLLEDAAEETEEAGEARIEQARDLTRTHLRGLLEALVFASDKPMKAIELARLASAPVKLVRELLAELKTDTAARGVVLDEVAGGWLFRTSAQYAPFVREMSSEKPVRLTRAQVETLAIAAYRQPVTRPEIDDIRGVDSGATLKLLLERDLVRILGKKDEPGRPLLYGTTTAFLEFFGLKSLKDLPTLKEFTELSEESRAVAEAELGDVLPDLAPVPASATIPSDTLAPPEEEHDTIAPPAPSPPEPAAAPVEPAIPDEPPASALTEERAESTDEDAAELEDVDDPA